MDKNSDFGWHKHATLIEDKSEPGQFRVEAEIEDGAVEVSTFSGPNAADRAVYFASTAYETWTDPEGWEEHLNQQKYRSAISQPERKIQGE